MGLWGVVITFLSTWEPPGDRQKQTGRASSAPAGNSPLLSPSRHTPETPASLCPWSWANRGQVHTRQGGRPWRGVGMGRFKWWSLGLSALPLPPHPHGLHPGSQGAGISPGSDHPAGLPTFLS